MYLHIGNGKSVRKDKIVGIFDLDTATVSKVGKDFLNGMERQGLVEYDDYDLPRSYILINDGEGDYVKLSRISSTGLKARAENRNPYLDDEKEK